MAQSLDWFNMMTYEEHGPWDDTTPTGIPIYFIFSFILFYFILFYFISLCLDFFHSSFILLTGINAPINSPDGYDLTDCVKGYLALGVPSSKLLLGAPTFAHSWVSL
jgi:GH18 family chitinase